MKAYTIMEKIIIIKNNKKKDLDLEWEKKKLKFHKKIATFMPMPVHFLKKKKY